MEVPAGWISETELRAAAGVADEEKKTFHRNLVNWRENGLLPRFYDGHQVPFVDYGGVGIGNEAWHPPITIEMVRRIDELRQRGTMDHWLWQLWLDGYPIDIIAWCRTRLARLLPLISEDVKDLVKKDGKDPVEKDGKDLIPKDAKDLVDFATRKPEKRSDPRRSFYRRLMARGWLGLMTWTVHIVIGRRPPESIFDPHSPLQSALARIFGTGIETSTIRAGLDGSGIEEHSVARLLAVLNEDIAAGELHKVREDCWVLSHSDKARRPVGIARILAAMWSSLTCRAGLLPALILLHRSPDHQDTLLDVAKRHSSSPTAHQFEIPHAR